jgi:hypothetical protein
VIINDQRFRPTICERIGEFVDAPAEIERHNDVPGKDGAREQLDTGQAVGEQDRQSIAAHDAETGQSG